MIILKYVLDCQYKIERDARPRRYAWINFSLAKPLNLLLFFIPGSYVSLEAFSLVLRL